MAGAENQAWQGPRAWGSPDGAAEEDGVLQDDGEARAQGVQRQFGDVNAVNDDAPCVETMLQVGHRGAGTWVPGRMQGKTVTAGPPVTSEHTPGLRFYLVPVGGCGCLWVAVGACGCWPYSPSNMSTMRKKAREKEDFPLPVRPQIPICKERSR